MKQERLHKRLAQAGIASRRTIEKWIFDGKIKVDGKVAQLGQTVTQRCKIQIDGKFISIEEKLPEVDKVIIYHKPEGEICSRVTQEGKPTIFKNLPRLKQGKWIMVGRLDVNTSGLLLLTNNGQIANQLMHPRYQIEREYAVRVLGQVTEPMLMRLKKRGKARRGNRPF